jgi:uncharacterized SAM-dependent methyltransferase
VPPGWIADGSIADRRIADERIANPAGHAPASWSADRERAVMNAPPTRTPATANCPEGSNGDGMRREVFEGLTATRKFLPCKYFYDGRGSALFEQICHLPEYYQTRTELSILRTAAPAVMANLSAGNLIELGSGANWKIRTLLDAADGKRHKIRYLPVDLCETALERAAAELRTIYPELTVSGMIAGTWTGFPLREPN